MTAADTLVIGGGVTGTVAAITLAEKGARVTILDAGTNAGSDANAGSLHVQMQSRFMRLYPDQVANIEASLPFYREAAEVWARLDEKLGGLDLVRHGGLMLAESAEQLAFLETKAKREAFKGLKVEILDRSALNKVAPWLGPQIVGAELCKDEGKLNPLIANLKLRTWAARLGVERRTVRVDRLDQGPGDISAVTPDGIFGADQIVIAAAWGSGDLVAPFGITIPSKAEPLHMNITESGAPAIQHLVQHAERSITLKQFGSGQIVIGGGWPATGRGNTQPPAVASSSLMGNVALAARLVPGIADLRVIRTWAGMNTTTDGASVIGRLPHSERIIMAIPGDAGYTLGPLVGQAAAAIALGEKSASDVERFSPQRFAA
jgi:glycine/D-amino acid oxidase-like deaminating enzyme